MSAYLLYSSAIILPLKHTVGAYRACAVDGRGMCLGTWSLCFLCVRACDACDMCVYQVILKSVMPKPKAMDWDYGME